MRKSLFFIAVFALALTICSCKSGRTNNAEGAESTDGTGVQASVAFGDSGAPGGAADAWQSSLRD